ncbi:type VI secretion system tube protein TssD [Pseudomonas sp. NPDC090202]|uniref:type VI secretion system tube protein TssD n=1 Tax=unclassified Pseudomonas TaxID=196821 RepID=UPI003809CC5D
MAHQAYMTIRGARQGFISENCSHQNSIGNQCQTDHIDQIMVLSYNHGMRQSGFGKHALFEPVHICKYLDKSSPLLALALDSGETLDCVIGFYRASSTGREKYYTVELKGAVVSALIPNMAESFGRDGQEMTELLGLRYRGITLTHHIAATTSHTGYIPAPSPTPSPLNTRSHTEEKAKDKTFARRFIVSDSENGQPLANRKYTATVDGQQITGVTDSNGIAHVEAASADSTVSIHITFRSPARELPELAGMTTRTVTTTTRVEEVLHGQTLKPVAISVNDRAATREAIIRKVRELGCEFVERSEWRARPPKRPLDRDWDYTMIALHHAGRSYSCSVGHTQMAEIQILQQGEFNQEIFDDVGYHFAIDCSGTVYEGRDIRYKGEHLRLYNSNAIGVLLINNYTTPEEGDDKYAVFRTALDAIGADTTNQVPDLQKNAATALTAALRNIFDIEHFGGHKEFPFQMEGEGEGKICPGNIGMELVEAIRAETNLPKPKLP